jgi:hypothetical protein
MSTVDLVRLCPWLLPQPRAFTPYELAVVHEAIADGMTIVNGAATTNRTEAGSLVNAIQVSTCPAFHANFGPAPAVPFSFYVCVGQTYAKLNPNGRQALDSAVTSGSLCGATGTLAPCNDPNAAVNILLATMPAAAAMMTQLGLPKPVIKPAEGLPQYTSFMVPTNADENLRARSAYQATTGRKILDLVTAMQRIPGVAASFPPAVQQLLALAQSPMAAMFLDREFILAASVRANINAAAVAAQISTVFGRGPASPPTPAELSQLATLIVEDVVAIWAPGQGFSVLPYILGQADPTQIIGMLAGMGLGGLIPPGVIPPGVIPPDLATQLGNIFGGLFTPPPANKVLGVPSKLNGVRWLSGSGNLGAYVGPPHPVIQQGSVGISVVEWQNILRQDVDSSKYTAPADGTFGPITDAATKLWQAAHGITPDGVVGAATWTAAYANYVPSNTYITPGVFDLLRLLVTPVNELTASDYKEPPLPANAHVISVPQNLMPGAFFTEGGPPAQPTTRGDGSPPATTSSGGSDSSGMLIVAAVAIAAIAAMALAGGGGKSAAQANPALPARSTRRANPQEHACVGGHPSDEPSWWEHDARGIPLCRVCDRCRREKLSTYRPEILSGYDQSDVNEPIEPDEPEDLWDRDDDYRDPEENPVSRRRNPCGCGAKRPGPGMLANPVCVCGGY